MMQSIKEKSEEKRYTMIQYKRNDWPIEFAKVGNHFAYRTIRSNPLFM